MKLYRHVKNEFERIKFLLKGDWFVYYAEYIIVNNLN